MDDIYYMQLALAQAQEAFDREEVPVGAVLVHRGRVLSVDHNRRQQRRDPIAHAEVLVIQQVVAGDFFPSWRLDDTTLYVTLEPCPLCAGAILQSRIPRVVFGATDPKMGAVVSMFRMLDDPRLNHRCELIQGVLEEPCREILQKFFRQQRLLGKK